MRLITAIGGCATCIVLAAPALAQDVQLASLAQDDLSDLSIEELAQIQVRSASKRDEPLGSAAAALYVVTGEEIESSGVTSLPEALRLAPNL